MSIVTRLNPLGGSSKDNYSLFKEWTSSTNYVLKKSGVYRIILVGGGGSGTYAYSITNPAYTHSSGGSGSYCNYEKYLESGQYVVKVARICNVDFGGNSYKGIFTPNNPNAEQDYIASEYTTFYKSDTTTYIKAYSGKGGSLIMNQNADYAPVAGSGGYISKPSDYSVINYTSFNGNKGGAGQHNFLGWYYLEPGTVISANNEYLLGGEAVYSYNNHKYGQGQSSNKSDGSAGYVSIEYLRRRE